MCLVDLTSYLFVRSYIDLQSKIIYFRKLLGIINAFWSDNYQGIVTVFLTIKKAWNKVIFHLQ